MPQRILLVGLVGPAAVVVVACSSSGATTDASNDTTSAGDTGSSSDAGQDDAHEGGATTTDAGFGQFMGPCNDSPDCVNDGVCYAFPNKGSYCTIACGDAGDGGSCPAPSPKCTPKGVCALPE